MLLYTTNTDTEFICNFLIFPIIKITLLQNCFSRVSQLFDNFFNTLHPFFHFIGKCICILFGYNPIKIGILFFNLPMPQIIYTAVPCLYIQVGCSCFRLQNLKIRGSRNLVGITIQLSNSEEKELFIRYSMQISSE